MNNSFFDLLNFDFSDLVKKLDEVKNIATDKYNNFVNNNVKKYDITTDDGYQAFISEAAEIRKQLDSHKNNPFAEKLSSWLDSLVNDATQKYNEAKAKRNENKNEVISDIVSSEVARSCKENGNRINTGVGVTVDNDEDEIDWPSSHITAKQKRNIWRLVDEYMDTMVVPYIPDEDYDEDVVDDMSSGLFEFAAWLLNHEDE